jgi:hypothetical protein
MIFTRENCKPINSPTQAQIERSLLLTKSSYAALTASDGSYLQTAGGPGLFFVEWRDANSVHYRGAQSNPVTPFPNGTVMSFSGGNVELASNEWFLAAQVMEIFGSFLTERPFPSWLHWSPLSPGYTRSG